jgi:FSR family fosmidomycin resistance protein-like MFS transporter
MVVMGILIGATFPVSIVMAQETWTSGVGIASGLVMGLGWLPGGVGASFTGYVADRLSLGTGLRLLIVPAVLGAGFILFYAIVRRTSAVKEREPTPSLSDADAQ